MRADILETKMTQGENIHGNKSKRTLTDYYILDMGQVHGKYYRIEFSQQRYFYLFYNTETRSHCQ